MIAKGLTVREAAGRLRVGRTALYEALRLGAGEITLAEVSASSAIYGDSKSHAIYRSK